MEGDTEARLRLQHILEEIEGVTATLAGTDFDTFRTSYAAVRITERALQIVSEAARTLPPALTEQHPQIPWSRIRGIGNFLRHEYHRLDAALLWDVVINHLPPLGAAARDMLASLDRRP